MHHHLNVAILLLSLIFASIALFALCTCQPKTRTNVNNEALEDASLSFLAAVPIRRRSDQSKEIVEIVEKKLPLIDAADSDKSQKPKMRTVRAYPISRLRESTSEEGDDEEDDSKRLKKRAEIQHLKLTDPAYHNADTLSQNLKRTVWNQLLTTMNLWKRDRIQSDMAPEKSYKLFKRFKKMNRTGESKTSQSLSKRDSLDCSARTIDSSKIDFSKAHRDADLAGLAPGFLIETEYLTPARKTIQRIPKSLDTDFIISDKDDDLLSPSIYDPQSATWAAKDIVGNILNQADDQELTPFIREGFSFAQSGSSSYTLDYPRTPSSVIHLTFPHYDLV